MVKKQNDLQKKLKISIIINIIFAVIFVSILSGAIYLKHAFDNGAPFIVQNGLIAQVNYCDNKAQLDKIKTNFKSEYNDQKDIKRAELSLNTICDTDGAWGRYYEKALKDYFKDNGISL